VQSNACTHRDHTRSNNNSSRSADEAKNATNEDDDGRPPSPNLWTVEVAVDDKIHDEFANTEQKRHSCEGAQQDLFLGGLVARHDWFVRCCTTPDQVNQVIRLGGFGVAQILNEPTIFLGDYE
jgi:hypothetical protein